MISIEGDPEKTDCYPPNLQQIKNDMKEDADTCPLALAASIPVPRPTKEEHRRHAGAAAALFETQINKSSSS